MRTRPRRPPAPPAPTGPRRAAQYLRMSSDRQRDSLASQAAAVAAYAAAHGYEIVRTYEDAGLSGVTADRRRGLQALLADVVGGAADFQAVLVYDVSRWGRFQDIDESAHYEFVCRQEGVEVVYCAEPFDAADPVSGAVLKQVKRVMAAEYSRHLSANVKAGQRRAAAEGFWPVGEPGYGLRRALADEAGRPVAILAPGARKAIQGQRVRLVAGPPEEVAVVREIYRLFLDEGLSRADIVRRLNGAGAPHTDGRPWTFRKVHHVLTGPAYAGDQVYGRKTYDLVDRRPRWAPTETWVIAAGVVAPCVSRADQARARRRIAGAMQLLDDGEMLRRLADLLAREGRLTSQIIKAAEGLPSPATYNNRFGSLTAAYARIGYAPARPRRTKSAAPGASADADPGEDRQQDQ